MRRQPNPAPELPGYTYLDFIGAGGFADVFRYRDPLGRNVAVKVSKDPSGPRTEEFLAEANLMARLSHHLNIVTIYQAGVAADGRTYLAMEECRPDDLGQVIRNRTLTPSQTMSYTIQLASAVETAHRLGVLHRDIKPANILFFKGGTPRPALTDFGISVAAGESGNNALSPFWAPPEQHSHSGLPVGPWSDVFSLAATAWAMLVGRSPLDYPGEKNDRAAIRHRLKTFVPKPTGRADVPQQLEQVLATALTPDPTRRYQSALDLARALQSVQAQMNEAVTLFEVQEDNADEPLEQEIEVGETGTVFAGADLFIDPYQADDSYTSQITGPSGGQTSQHDYSGLPASGIAQAPNMFIAQHGRGHAQAGLRDFTSPGIPQPSLAPAPPGSPAAEEAEPGKKRGAAVAVGIVAAILAVGAGGWLVVSGLGGQSATAERPPSVGPASVAPQDALGTRVSPPLDLAGTVEGDEATFTWANPDEKPGDTYLVSEVSRAELIPPTQVETTTVTVPIQPGQTCIEVTVRRGSGYVSAPVRGCVTS